MNNPGYIKNFSLLFVSQNGTFKSLSEYFQNQGLKIIKCLRPAEALVLVREEKPQAVIIDTDFQEVEALEFCQDLKSDVELRDIKTLFFSSRQDQSEYEARSFETGIDDYISKPFHESAVIKRIQFRCAFPVTTISLKESHSSNHRLHIDRESYSVTINNQIIPVSRKEFELLYLLASQPGKVFTRNEIYLKVWGKKPESSDRTIDVHILRLRKKLGNEFIGTQKGIGYRFVRL